MQYDLDKLHIDTRCMLPHLTSQLDILYFNIVSIEKLTDKEQLI